ncbi:unnamed protein product [Staurois parvus]|uniref:Uncharacterized protein n=2 Tax=Staurois parvus TaxID=386267 RepID=A0ABN9CLV5_9NEOB|nr:unnamed protein product [Staurois parvus]CAI9609820.1 unnamed protein product [Staurois parvus]
MSVLSAGNTFQ